MPSSLVGRGKVPGPVRRRSLVPCGECKATPVRYFFNPGEKDGTEGTVGSPLSAAFYPELGEKLNYYRDNGGGLPSLAYSANSFSSLTSDMIPALVVGDIELVARATTLFVFAVLRAPLLYTSYCRSVSFKSIVP